MKKLLIVFAVLLLVMPITCWGAEKTLTFSWQQDIPSDMREWYLEGTDVPPPASWTSDPATWVNDPRDWTQHYYEVTIPYTTTQDVYTATKTIMAPAGAETTLWFRIVACDQAAQCSDPCYGDDIDGLATITLDFAPPGKAFGLKVKVNTQ